MSITPGSAIQSPSARSKYLLNALKALRTLPGKTILYGSALLGIAAIGGADLTGPLAMIAGGVSVEALGILLDRLTSGEEISAAEIQKSVVDAIAESGIEQLITRTDFQDALGRVLRQQHLIRAAVEHGEFTLASQLAEQYADHQGLLFEMQDDLVAMQGQLQTLATHEQGEAIITQLNTLTAHLQRVAPSGPAGQSPLLPRPVAGQLTELGVFLASPGDVSEERKRAEKVIRELNEAGMPAHASGYLLRLLRWEDALGGMGRGQGVLLAQMPAKTWHLFVGMLWTRFGSATGETDPTTGLPFNSGTEEEFKHAYRTWQETGKPHILFYRCGKPIDPDTLDIQQFGKVRDFFKQFETSGAHPGLYTRYEGADDFEQRLRKDITKWLNVLPRPRKPSGAAQTTPTPAAANHDDLERPYLEWLVRTHSRLDLRGIRVQGHSPTVALDRVFVALKGGQSSQEERSDSRELLEQEAIELGEQMAWDAPTKGNRWQRRWQVLAHSPIMPSLVERDRPSVFTGERPTEVLNLGEAFRRFRWLVVLGDPGSGKTTLARWLTLHLAQALRDGVAQVQVRASQVDPAEAEGASVDLGPARLPVLVRISDFAEARQKHKTETKDGGELSLADYLGHQPWLGEHPTFGQGHPFQGERIPAEGLNALIKNRLRQGRAVIILDGLDEITRGTERDGIVHAVESFMRTWIISPDGDNPFDDLTRPWRRGLDRHLPSSRGGNQLMATSRIAGYHASPLSGHMAHFTIEPMGGAAIDRFCESWTQAVHELLAPPDESQSVVQERAQRAAVALKAAIHDPDRPGVAEMASNPLLLTILALVHHNTDARLPEQRVRLYQIAVQNLTEVWRDTGLTEDEMVNVLGPVAAHIHTHYATGLIPEPELRGLLATHLAAYRYPDLDPQTLPPDFNKTVDNFLEQVRVRVGMLAARGEYLYGFLHLTFQEYLAARHLVRDPDQALTRILEQIDDPRWREPVLLALGYVMVSQGLEARERLLQGLLEAPDPLGDLLPRRALLLAAALPEFVHMPGRIVGQVSERLVTAYADRQGSGRFDFLRGRSSAAWRACTAERRPARSTRCCWPC